MDQLKSLGLPETGRRAEESAPAAHRGSRAWIWIVIIGVLALGFWIFRSSRSKAATASASSSGSSRGKGAAGGNFSVPVVVATAKRGDLPVYFNGLGTVTPLNTVTVRSRVDGQLINVAFKEGQIVHQGDLLAEIDPRPYQVQLEQAEGQLAKDVAQRKDANVNYERYKLLYQEGVIPKQQLDTQQATVDQFDGSIKSDQSQIDNAKLELVYCHITSPLTGRVGLRLVDPGNIVHATDTGGLVVITQLQPISVIFSLPQDQLPQVYDRLRKGEQLSVDAYDRDNTKKIATGKLLTIDNQIDTTTGTYKLKSVFNNEDSSLFPNQFVNVHLLVNTKHDLALVPVAAVQRGPEGTYVYVVGSDNKVKIQQVTVAETTGGITGVSAGLQGGEVVVTDGQDKLQDGSKVIPNTSPTGNATPAETNASSTPSSAQKSATATASKTSAPRSGGKRQ
ncbi:MAG TPA: MdtA/MuxA family multidrug efflux RND transporter periplasmic adaptor subunit [Terriglobales bacterium]|nr:MdtA/MuxA family multidrug efflux RND transporter periplasmic adaptor subunit [Terriglobales bacterium]